MSDLDDGLLDDEGENSEADSDGPDNYFPTMYAFVDEYLVHLYAHEIRSQITDVRWCPMWWEHPGVVARIEALWKAFEVLRLDSGTGMSVWFNDHADPCMAVLLASEGPFTGCSDTLHKVRPALPVVPAPAWLTEHKGSTSG